MRNLGEIRVVISPDFQRKGLATIFVRELFFHSLKVKIYKIQAEMMETQEKIQKFAEIVQEQEKQAILRLCDGSLADNETAYIAHIRPRRKYTLVDVGNSGRYMIEGEKVYGCKAYGVIHRGHFYGTLDDILERGSVARCLVLKSGRRSVAS